MESTKQNTVSTRLYVFWSMVVSVNAAIGLLYGGMLYGKNWVSLLAIGLAVLSYIIIYSEVDRYLLLKGYQRVSRQLRIAAWLRAGTQLFPVFDLWVGMFSMAAVNVVLPESGVWFDDAGVYNDSRATRGFEAPVEDRQDFLFVYLVTMLHAFILSLVVGVFVALLRWIASIRQKNAPKPS